MVGCPVQHVGRVRGAKWLRCALHSVVMWLVIVDCAVAERVLHALPNAAPS